MYRNRKTQTSRRESLSLPSSLRFSTSIASFCFFTIYIPWQGKQNALISNSISGCFHSLASTDSLQRTKVHQPKEFSFTFCPIHYYSVCDVSRDISFLWFIVIVTSLVAWTT
ncbi:hypothetical protein P5673_021428 [Acropora cervicornis]|uniref:Uncharacterized protein n=1 Tax=Acropora cervicornis TaxID=6130 RepID=A0AAD9Q8Z6_ACRCE|nr:hypothetical protein P5673_021428 [Acropora cervicornis]